VNALLVVAITMALFVGYGLIDNRWYHIIEVSGSSMNPTINAGDAIVIVRPPQRIEAGMILVFEVNGGVVTHRVVSVAPDGTFTTQGDANPTPDDWAPEDVTVVGRYVFRIPDLGRVLTALPFPASERSAAFLTDADSATADVAAVVAEVATAEG
jgi:signal peptidase I